MRLVVLTILILRGRCSKNSTKWWRANLSLMANIMSAWHTSAYVGNLKSGGLSTAALHAMGDTKDLREYNYWSKTFKNLGLAAPSAVVDNGATIIPMAGLGQRFASEGYLTTKPLIPVSGRTMVAQATDDLPQTPVKVFVVRADMPDYDRVVTDLIGNYPEAEITTLEKVTDGQARTAALGVDQLECLGFGSSSR